MDSVELVIEAVTTKGKANLSFSGKSMYPTLKDSMSVTIARIPPESIKVSDIIAYQQDNQIVAHRVIKIIRNNGEFLFITKGDNQPFGGISHIQQNDLLGKIDSACFKESPSKNVLNKNIFYRLLYVFIGRLYIFYRRFIRKLIPENKRIFLKLIIGKFYFQIN